MLGSRPVQELLGFGPVLPNGENGERFISTISLRQFRIVVATLYGVTVDSLRSFALKKDSHI